MNSVSLNGLPQENVDRLLISFLKKEMPEPWPAPKLPRPSGVIPARGWFGAYGRLALVASVALLLTGYLALAELFPGDKKGGLQVDREHTIGSRIGVPQRVRTSSGREAVLSEQMIPGEPPTFIINVAPVQSQPQR
jgi:hypothetical protein